jgi:hypothetical protein
LPGQISSIPIGLVEPHPKLMLRFSYEVDSLAESIRASVDENTPNGQLNPGRVVPKEDGKGYLVYMGVRRYFALKLLYEKTRDERFATYNAYIDTNMSELQMFIRAKRENDEEKGERRGLSLLEEVLGMNRIKESISNPKELSPSLARRLEIAETTSEEKLRKLYDIEQATKFRFGVAHLQGLGRIADDQEFFLTAACVAEYRLEAGDIESAVRGRRSAYAFRWFEKMFPDYRPSQGNGVSQSQAEPTSARTTQSEPSSTGDTDQESDQEPSSAPVLEVHEKNVIVVACPECGCENLVRVRGTIEVTQLAIEPNGEGYRATPETVSRFSCKCNACDEEFYILLKHVGGREYAVESPAGRAFREPKTAIQAVDLRYDQKKGVWQKIVGSKVVGVIKSSPAEKKMTGRS